MRCVNVYNNDIYAKSRYTFKAIINRKGLLNEERSKKSGKIIDKSGKKSGKKTTEDGQIIGESGKKTDERGMNGCMKTAKGCMENEDDGQNGCKKTDGGCKKTADGDQDGCKKTDGDSKKTIDIILSSIGENSKITYRELSGKLGISIQAIQKHIENLKAKGIIKRVGPDKGGHWEIIQTND